MKKFLVILLGLMTCFVANVNAQEWTWRYYFRASYGTAIFGSNISLIKNDNSYKLKNIGGNAGLWPDPCANKILKDIELINSNIIIAFEHAAGFCGKNRIIIKIDDKNSYEQDFINGVWVNNEINKNMEYVGGAPIEILVAGLKEKTTNLASQNETKPLAIQNPDQDKINQNKKITEETNLQEQQRFELETQQKEQARLAQEAKQKDQERQLADQKVKEQLRLAEETAKSKDLELAKLKEELARVQEQNAKQKLVTANRRAFVVGNDSYKQVNKLFNSREDARTIADNLSRVGYSVTTKLDMSEREMRTAWRIFKSQIQPGDEVAFFYAGHGVQLGNTNYLLPVDVSNENEDQIKDEGMTLQRILDDLSERKARFSIAMIDACRDNPFVGSGRNIGGTSRGLAPTTAATGQMIIFSAGAGQQALDRLGPQDKNKNGVFTRVFVKEMLKPGISVDRVVRNVRNEVVELARSIGHEQVPAIYDQVVGEFFFTK